MYVVLAIAGKDARQLLRDRAGLFWALAFPLVVSILFGSIFSDDGSAPRPIRVAVVDEDQSAASQRMLERLGASPSLEVERSSRAQAIEAVRKGRVVAYLGLLPGYGESDKILPVNPGAIELGTDPSKQATTAVLQGVLMEAVYAEMTQLLGDRDRMRVAIRQLAGRMAGAPGGPLPLTVVQPLEQFVSPENLAHLQDELRFDQPRLVTVARSLDGRPRTSYEITFPQSTGWALIAIIAFFATVIARERDSGNLMRLRLAPISLATIVVGKGLAALAVSLSIMLVVLGVGVVGFDLGIEGRPQLALALLCSSFSAAGLIVLFSTLGKTAQAVEGACWTILIPLFMAGGGMLPLVFMPEWLQTVSHFSPLKWNLYAVEGAVWRDFSMVEMLLPCGILVAIGLAAAIVGGLILSRSRG